jgi:hypothetical protein
VKSDKVAHTQVGHLIAGLQGVRAKLNNDGDRLHREIEQHAAFGQSIIQLTKIVSDGMASVAAGPEPNNAATIHHDA